MNYNNKATSWHITISVIIICLLFYYNILLSSSAQTTKHHKHKHTSDELDSRADLASRAPAPADIDTSASVAAQIVQHAPLQVAPLPLEMGVSPAVHPFAVGQPHAGVVGKMSPLVQKKMIQVASTPLVVATNAQGAAILAANKRQARRERRRQQRQRRQQRHKRLGASALLVAGAGAGAAAAAAETAATTSLGALESIVEEARQVAVGVSPLSSSNTSPLSSAMSEPGPISGGGGGGGGALGVGGGLTTVLSKIINALNVTEFAVEIRDGISSRASCLTCNAVAGLFLSPLYSKEVFSVAIRTVCTSFKIQTPRVCAGLVAAFEDDFEYIRRNTRLSRDEICAVVFGTDCSRRMTNNLYWTVPIAPPVSGANLPVVSQPSVGNLHVSSSSTASSSSQDNSGGVSSTNQPTTTSFDDAPDRLDYRKQQASGQSNNRRRAVSSKSEPAKRLTSFVQITDIHIDPYYEENSLSDCLEPLCCRATSGGPNAQTHQPSTDPHRHHGLGHIHAHHRNSNAANSLPGASPSALRNSRRAGRWGDYGNCDTPVRTLKSALERIKYTHPNAEYWLWTGDISPHDIWNISKAETIKDVRLVSKMLREYSNGIPVLPVVGNHEAHPVNSFAPPQIKGKFSMSWLYDTMAEEWSTWLPEDAVQTLRIGGYYKYQMRRGLRILSINTNYCARLNPWSFYDPVDPAHQLEWLAKELYEAEQANDKVHIIGHVPPDNRECTQAWLYNFINIVDRFQDTILGQFYGHTHRDEFRVIYSIGNQDEPIGVQYIGPSITPFTENNPAYRVYHQDSFGYLFDFETYYFNLTEANNAPENVEPNWKFSYRVYESLNMTQGLSPFEWNLYVQRMHESDELFDKFHQNFYRSSDVKANQVCRNKCKHQLLSDLCLLDPYKTKPKPFLSNRKTSNHNNSSANNNDDNKHRHRHRHRHHHLRRPQLPAQPREPKQQPPVLVVDQSPASSLAKQPQVA